MGSSAKTETKGTVSPPSSNQKPPATNGSEAHPHPPIGPDQAIIVSDPSKKKRMGILPLEVGTRVMCRWRDGKHHPVKVIERRRIHNGGPNDYEYYVHYTECISFNSLIKF